MSYKSNIEWTQATWNPITGCWPKGIGCWNCYAARMASGWPLKNNPRYKGLTFKGEWTGEIRLHPDILKQPLHWRKPRRVFVCSMSDLFYSNIPTSFIQDVYSVMAAARQHRFMVCTKRPERISRVLYGAEYGSFWGPGDYLSNVIHLTSIESAEYLTSRLNGLWSYRRSSGGKGKIGLSLEPLLGPINLSDALSSLDWVIVGGETGPGARPMNPDWARSIRDQCKEAGVPYFFKQMSKRQPIPADLMVREYPENMGGI